MSLLRPHISIVVANWEGEAWIARTLSSLQLSARAAARPFEIIVVDDASRDASRAIVRDRFPRVRLIANERNLGFGPSTMRGVRAAAGKILILCNNDLVVKEEFVPHLARWFDRSRVELPTGESFPRARLFGVSARTLSWYDGMPNQLCMTARWAGGRLTPAWSDPPRAARCLFVQAGAAAYNRAHFLRLGGFSPLFAPGYWEDYDLSYRAAKAGLINVYDPEALALHHGGGSMTRRYGADGVARLRARNHLLFEWANLGDPALVARYCARLAASVGREWLRGGDPRLTRALLDALPALPRVWRERMRRHAKVSDAEVLEGLPQGQTAS